MTRHPILGFVQGHRGFESGSLDDYFDKAGTEAWSLVRQMGRSNPGIVDESVLELATRRIAESPGAFFALLLDIAFKDPARRADMIGRFRRLFSAYPGPALGAAGYNLHEYHALLDPAWIAVAREHLDANPEGAWGIVEAAAMYEHDCLTPADVDWLETRRATMPRDYFVVMLSLALSWKDRRADYVARVLRHFPDHPAEAIEAVSFTIRSTAELQSPELVAAVLRTFDANPEKAWEFFEGAARCNHAIFDDSLLDALDSRAVAGPGTLFTILRQAIEQQPDRAGRLLDRYVALLRRHPEKGIDGARYAFQRDDIKLLRPDLIQAVCAGFAAAPYAAYELLWHCMEDRPELIGAPEVEAAITNIPNATNRAFGFFRELIKRRPEFTRECTLALFECLAMEPAHRAFNREEFVSSIIAISEASHIRTGLETALREPPKVGSRRGRALMAILFRQKLRARRHVLMEALRYAGGIVLWHKVGAESEKFSPVWDFLFFIIDIAADDTISTSAAERFLEGAFQLHHLCRTGAERETLLRNLDIVEGEPRPFPAAVAFLASDAELARLHTIVRNLGERFAIEPRIAALDDFTGRLAAAEIERKAVAAKGLAERLRTLDRHIACWKDPAYTRAFNDIEAEKALPEDARALLRREKKDLAKRVRDGLRSEAVRIAIAAVEHSRLDLYRGRLRDVLGHDVDIQSIEPRILPSFLWFQAIGGMRNNTLYLRKLIEDRIAHRDHDWLRTEAPAQAWAARVRQATPEVRLERWRATFTKEFNYHPKDALAEKRRRIKADLAQARALLEKAGAKPASDTHDELAARLAELRAGIDGPKDEKKPPKVVDPALLEEVAMNLQRVRIVEQTPESDFEGRIVLSVETDPFEILFMGEYGFASCLSLRGSNAWSAVSNAIDIDKVIIWAKEPGGNVVGRRLLALLPEGVVQYSTYSNRHGLALDGFFEEFVGEYARHCGTRIVHQGRPGPLLSDRWYDDGAI